MNQQQSYESIHSPNEHPITGQDQGHITLLQECLNSQQIQQTLT